MPLSDETREAFYARHRPHMRECPDCSWWYCGLVPCGCDRNRGLLARGS